MARTEHKSTARACIFCGAPPDSGEHILPDWLRDVLPSGEAVVHFRQVGGGERHEWERRPFREKTQFVCEPCNTGWMSRLEGKSKPILTPPITRSGTFQLDSASQEIAATWAIKTVLVFQGTQAPQPLAPPHHFAQVREHERPPPSVSVWIGSHYRARFDPVNSVYTQKPLTLEPLDEKFVKASRFGYASFLAIGGLSFLVIGHRYRNRVVINCGEPFGDAVTKIWPVSALAVGWPPPLMMDRELLDAFFMRNEPPTLDVQVFGP